MKLTYSIKVYVLLVFTFVPVLSMAQEWRNMSQEAIDSILNPRLLDEAQRMVRFDSTVVNIGQLTEDDKPVAVRFSFQNIGAQPLVITTIRTNCGCTDAQADKIEYASGDKGCVVVEYNPKNHPGTIDKG